jgi:ankyrin repeat protein
LGRDLRGPSAAGRNDGDPHSTCLTGTQRYPSTNKNGTTALMDSGVHGQVEVAKLLLHKGTDDNAQDKSGSTALTRTTEMRNSRDSHAEVEKLLRRKGQRRILVCPKLVVVSFTTSWCGCVYGCYGSGRGDGQARKP